MARVVREPATHRETIADWHEEALILPQARDRHFNGKS